MRELPARRRSSTRWSRSTRSTCGSATRACSSSCRSTSRPRTSSRDYAYFSSYSDSLGGARARATSTTAIDRLRPRRRTASSSRSPATTATCCSTSSRAGIPVLGIEPAANIAEVAREQGHPDRGRVLRRATLARAGRGRARPGGPRRRATTSSPTCPTSSTSSPACERCSPPTASLTIEFPHLLRLIEGNQFDTIYHEHFSYFSLHDRQRVFARARPERLRRRGAADPRRVAARSTRSTPRRERQPRRRSVERCWPTRGGARLRRRSRAYGGFAAAGRGDEARAARVPDRAPSATASAVAGYGAPGKGNTLLNYCGIRDRPLDYTVDRNPYKQGRFLPGTHIPILAPERARRDAARLHPDPAVEPAGRDRRAARATSRELGRAGSSVPIPRRVGGASR